MVHRIFKNIVSHTNRKNIGLDLLKRYTTLQSIRYLADGGIDIRYLRSHMGFINISHNTNHLFKNWFIIEESLESDNIEPNNEESDDAGNCILLILSRLIQLVLIYKNFLFFNSNLTI